jgi:signal transduction histidine kinase
MSSIWPVSSAADSESLRRRKFAVRLGHGAMAALLAVAVASGVEVSSHPFSPAKILCLSLASLAYIAWNLAGSSGVVRLVLWEQSSPPSMAMRVPPCGALPFFAIQLALATFVYLTAFQGLVPNQVWLAMLPPVAYSVFILEWRGIALVSLITLTVFICGFLPTHNWRLVASSTLAFSFAVLFTIVFTLLAVHSEKARHEVQRLATELSQANRQLRDYLVQAEELSASRERNRIAREIHDSLGHFLTVANVQLQAARSLWDTDPARAREAVAKAQNLAQEGLQDIRRSVASLRSSPLDNKALTDALRELAAAETSAETGVVFQLLGQPRKLPPAVELSLYRAAQEGLTNARKHSRSAQARLTMDFQNSANVRLTAADDGLGAAPEALSNGFGLIGLRERAQLLRGELRVESAPGKGFALIFEVPG